MKFAIIKNNKTIILPPHGAAFVFPIVPATMTKASGTMIGHKAEVCLEGDETDPKWFAIYLAPPFVIPGIGKVVIKALAGDQLTKKIKHQDKAIIRQGLFFDTEFQVMLPAMMPTPRGPVPDVAPSYAGGKGMFVPTNTKLMVN